MFSMVLVKSLTVPVLSVGPSSRQNGSQELTDAQRGQRRLRCRFQDHLVLSPSSSSDQSHDSHDSHGGHGWWTWWTWWTLSPRCPQMSNELIEPWNIWEISPWKRRGIDSELGWEVVVYQHSEMGFAKKDLGSTPADDAAFGSQYYWALTTQNGDI